MCFSATASFTVSAALVPLGLYTIARVRRVNPAWLGFAAFPLAFGVQQALEGVVWLGLEGGNDAAVCIASRGFLFFSHLFWLTWVPFAVWLVEPEPARKRVIGIMTAIGCVYGLSVFLPSFLIRDWLQMEVVERSLDYKTTLIYDGIITRAVLRLFYAALVVGALFLSSHRRIQVFGGLIAASLALTYAFYAYAFISVWCFFAAILSFYLVVILIRDARAAGQ